MTLEEISPWVIYEEIKPLLADYLSKKMKRVREEARKSLKEEREQDETNQLQSLG